MMKKVMKAILMAAVLAVGPTWAATVEDWTGVSSGNTGSFADDKGSKITFETVEGPQKDEKALSLDCNEVSGGYCGLWHNVDFDLSKADSIKFKVKADVPTNLSLSITDANKVQYVVSVAIPSKDWTEVTVPFSSLEQNKYYQPDGADKTKPMDLSHVQGMGMGPGASGASKIWMGPITTGGGAAPADKAKDKDKAKKAEGDTKAAGKGTTLVLQDYDVDDPGLGGVWKDDKGTTIEMTFKPAKKKNNPADRAVVLKYNLTPGGWCGVWYRAGGTWDGLDLSKAKSIVAKVYSDKPLQFGISMEDGAKLKFDGASPLTTGGRWETVTIPMDSLPDGFGTVKTFNVYMKTAGENVLSIDQIVVIK